MLTTVPPSSLKMYASLINLPVEIGKLRTFTVKTLRLFANKNIKYLSNYLVNIPSRHNIIIFISTLFSYIINFVPQEDISLKKYDYRATQLHLASVRAQVSPFAPTLYIPKYSNRLLIVKYSIRLRVNGKYLLKEKVFYFYRELAGTISPS